jgi:1-acyl-sn-glycerol-3-phosphate acyltransferase
MDSWRYEPTADFDKDPIDRLKSFPRHPDLFVYTARMIGNFLMRTAMRIWHRLEIAGRENLPREGSFVIVANHASHLDAAALLSALSLTRIHRAFPVAASDYFFTNLPALAFSAVVMNAMPFDRKDNPKYSLSLCRQLLEAPGHILILFPEGTRSLDGNVGRFKPGIGFLIAGTEFPVVPCHISGAWRAWPKGKWIPRPRKLRLVIGEPLRFQGRKPVKDDAVAIAEILRDRVMELASTPAVAR